MINTTLCYIEKDGQYLMLLRNKKKNDLNEGKWVGVGGKFEPGESAEECLVREVHEETGLTLTEWRFIGVINFLSDKWEDEAMHLYLGTKFDGDLADCNEGELKWIPKGEVLNLPMWEGDHYFLEPMISEADPHFQGSASQGLTSQGLTSQGLTSQGMTSTSKSINSDCIMTLRYEGDTLVEVKKK